MKKLLFGFLVLFAGFGQPSDVSAMTLEEANQKVQEARLVVDYVRSIGSEGLDLIIGGQAAYNAIMNNCIGENFNAINCAVSAPASIAVFTSQVSVLASLLNGEVGEVFTSDCSGDTIFCSVGGATIEEGITSAKVQFADAFGDEIIQETDIKAVIINFLRYILGFLGLVCVIILIWAGVVYITSLGNDDRVGMAKNIIINTIIGILIILFAYVVVTFFTNIGTDLS